MEITYLGHSCFKLKSKQGTVVTDPYGPEVGFSMPSTSADIITVSHGHFDHNAVKNVSGTARREKPFLITSPGEYEVGGISVFGYPTYHDAVEGKEKGSNVIYVIQIDGVRIAHLGDLGHELSESLVEELGTVDVLLCPVAGVYGILDAKGAIDVIHALEPSYVVPMHYLTDKHDKKAFIGMQTAQDFMKEYGVSKEPVELLSVNAGSLPDSTELVLLRNACP